jgi:LITAF-like zinc ribbon domain
MNPIDRETFQQAVQFAQNGQREAAYNLVSTISRVNENYNDPDVLLLVADTTPHQDEAQQALDRIIGIAPNHPGLPTVRNRHLERISVQAQQNRPLFQCPFCHTSVPPRVGRKISTTGWVVFILLTCFLITIPFCWIGLLIKEDYRVCSMCGMKFG